MLSLRADGSDVRVEAEVERQPSGLGWLPDGRLLPVGPGLGDRRDWARFGNPPTSRVIGEVLSGVAVAPDGICGDAEGAVWVADALGNRAVRVRPGGVIAGPARRGDRG